MIQMWEIIRTTSINMVKEIEEQMNIMDKNGKFWLRTGIKEKIAKIKIWMDLIAHYIRYNMRVVNFKTDQQKISKLNTKLKRWNEQNRV